MDAITVFSGLSKDNSPAGLAHCRRVGEIIAEQGFKMVCAGASVGCQQELIDGALGKGGTVIAVTVPRFASELSEALKEHAIIASGNDLSQRKQIMKQQTEYGYIILPGGPGTLDELWEVFAEKEENINDGGKKRLILVNTEGFYEPVKTQIEIMRKTFNWPQYGKDVEFVNDPEELTALLAKGKGGRRKTRRNRSRRQRIRPAP